MKTWGKDLLFQKGTDGQPTPLAKALRALLDWHRVEQLMDTCGVENCIACQAIAGIKDVYNQLVESKSP